MVVVDSVVVGWIDLGTKLVLRHLVRVLGAEQEGQGGDNNSQTDNQRDNGSENKGEGTTQDHTAATSRAGGGAEARALTAEVDLDEVRWAECTGRKSERRLSKSNAKKLAGNRHVCSYSGGANPYTARRTEQMHSKGLARGSTVHQALLSVVMTQST